MLMYADDTTLYCNIDQYVNEDVINVELAKLSEWLEANKLALNISKTKFMFFHTSNRAVQYPNLKIITLILNMSLSSIFYVSCLILK